MSYKKAYKYEKGKLVVSVSADLDADGKPAVEVDVKLDVFEVVDEGLRAVLKDPELADKVASYKPHVEAVVQAFSLAKKSS